MPVKDLARDVLASLALLISLAFVWDAQGTWAQEGRSRTLIEVLLVVILTAVAAWLPYLARAGVFPPTWTAAQTRLLRLGIAAPYVLVVVIHLVIGLIQSLGDDGGFLSWGTSQMVGLAGVALIATPRSIDFTSDDERQSAAALWRNVIYGLLGVAAVGYAATVILGIIDASKSDLGVWLTIVAVISLLGAFAVMIVPAFLAIKRPTPAWRRVAVTLAVTLVAAAFLGLDENSLFPQLEAPRLGGFSFGGGFSMSGLGMAFTAILPLPLIAGFGVFLLPAAAVILLSPALDRPVDPAWRVFGWVQTVAALLAVETCVAVLVAVSSIGILVTPGTDDFTTGAVTTLVLAIIIAAGSAYGAYRAAHGAPETRMLSLIVAGLELIFGIVILVMAPELLDGNAVTFGHLLLAFGIPLTVAGAFFVPAPMRNVARPAQPQGAPAPAAPGAPVQQYPPAGTPAPTYAPAPVAPPAQYPPQGPTSAPVAPPAAPVPNLGAPAEPVSEVVRQAADPATPAETLAQLAAEHPETWVALAGNPSTYSALLDWLAALGDPAVNAALAGRSAQPPQSEH